jgi:hypothetical protein
MIDGYWNRKGIHETIYAPNQQVTPINNHDVNICVHRTGENNGQRRGISMVPAWGFLKARKSSFRGGLQPTW